MADSVYKKITLVGTSEKSFSDAAAVAVAKAAETIKNMSWFEVVEQRGSIVDGKIQQFQVTVSIGAPRRSVRTRRLFSPTKGFVRRSVADRRRRGTVARKQHGLVGQGEQLRLDSRSQLRKIAVWKIRSADRSLEDHVAHEHDAGRLMLDGKNHMPD